MTKKTKGYIDKPWGYESLWACTEQYVGKLLHIKPGRRLSRQYHEIKDETIYVLDGRLVLELGMGSEMETKEISRGDTFHIKPGTIHRFCAPPLGPPVILMEVSTPELDDVVRLEDDYNRS